MSTQSIQSKEEQKILKKFVDSLDHWLTEEDIGLNMYGCVECNQCGEACAWYIETGEEEMHPKVRADFIRKVWKRYKTPMGKILGSLGLIDSPTVDDLRKNMYIYWQCTLCGRCTLACPMNISNRSLYRAMRAAYTESGLSYENPTIRSIIENTEKVRHSFGLSREYVFARPGLFLGYEGVELPVDVKGAEYMFVCPSAGNTKIPELGIKLIKLLNTAQINYTISSKVVDTGTEIDHIAVHHELSKVMLEEWENAAEELNSKYVIVAECGCDVRTMYVEAEKTLGRPFKFPIISIDTILERAIDEGKLPVEPIDESVTFHDPCYVVRLSGRGEEYRRFLPKVVKDFREMTPNREQNYCCNGGAGGMRLPENTEKRRKISRLKAEQIKNTGADLVTTPCAVCYLNLKDTTEVYGIATSDNRKARMLFEIVYDAMMKALTKLKEENRVKIPYVFKNMSKEQQIKHSLSGFMEKLTRSNQFIEILKKLKDDPNVHAYAKENPGFWKYFEKIEKEALSLKN
jgi:Fe-S oxidoreductase